MKPNDQFALKFFALMSKLDNTEGLFWRRDPDGWFLAISCSDVFVWACADLEPVETEADLEALKQAFSDSEIYGEILYCARRRGMRPQGAFYPARDKSIWLLFDACGPEREVGIGNPYAPGRTGKCA